MPFCATRCGYCDFNTYTAAELGDSSPDGWLAALRTELELAAAHLGEVPEVSTVFVGGGTRRCWAPPGWPACSTRSGPGSSWPPMPK